MRVALAVVPCGLLLLAGCAVNSQNGLKQTTPSQTGMPTTGAKLSGSVRGGQQAITGASIQLYAAGTSGYGAGATALLSPAVTTDLNGNFTITGDYTCPSSSSLLYIVATQGNPGLGTGTNPAIALAAALGSCTYAGSNGPTLNPTTYIVVNEATTVAAVYSLAQFWQPNSFLVGTSATNTTGLANAFTTAQTLVQNSTGTAYSTTPPLGSATVPQGKINTLANILAACVNTNGTDGTCASIFSAVAPQNSTAPTNTIAALLDIALSPATNVSSLYAFNQSTAPFQPALTSVPTDFSLAEVVHYPGMHTYDGVAPDSYGNIWSSGALSSGATGVIEVSPAGDPLSGAAPGYTDSHFTEADLIAIDANNNVWAVPVFSQINGIVEFANNGADLTPAGGILTPPLINGMFYSLEPYHIVAIAATGSDIVLANGATGSNNPSAPEGGAIELNASGTIINNTNEFNPGTINSPASLALDSANTIWLGNGVEGTGASISHVDFNGNPVGTSPTSGGGLSDPRSMATDNNRNLWVANYNSLPGTGTDGSVSKFDSNGNPLSPSNGYTDSSLALPEAISVDGAGFVWVADYENSIVKLSSSGTFLSGPSGYTDPSIYNPNSMAIDASGNVWLANLNYGSAVDGGLTKFIGIAAPVVTPLGLNGSYGQRP